MIVDMNLFSFRNTLLSSALYIFAIAVFVSQAAASEQVQSLHPSVAHSYCYLHEASITVLIAGEDWGLRTSLPMSLPTGSFVVVNADFHRGPQVYRYLQLSGPPVPPVPKTTEYKNGTLHDLSVNVKYLHILGGNSGEAILAVKDFSVDGMIFSLPNPIHLVCSAPPP